WMPLIVERHGCRAILGKGGLLEASTKACQQHGCVYLSTLGGAASHYDSHAKIMKVHWADLTSQAILELELKEYGPCFVAIDAHGNNHYLNQRELLLKRRSEIYGQAGISALSVIGSARKAGQTSRRKTGEHGEQMAALLRRERRELGLEDRGHGSADPTPRDAARTQSPPARRPNARLVSPLRLTDAAANKFHALLRDRSPMSLGIRLRVEAHGCKGRGYTLEFVDAPGPG